MRFAPESDAPRDSSLGAGVAHAALLQNTSGFRHPGEALQRAWTTISKRSGGLLGLLELRGRATIRGTFKSGTSGLSGLHVSWVILIFILVVAACYFCARRRRSERGRARSILNRAGKGGPSGLIKAPLFPGPREPGAPPPARSSLMPHLFVDANARAVYELRQGTRLYRNGVCVTNVRVGDDPNLLRVTRGVNGFEDDALLRLAGPRPGVGAKDWFSLAKSFGEELSPEGFRARFPSSDVAHIKGISSGLSAAIEEQLMEKLQNVNILVWDGDDYAETGFTKLIAAFLESNRTGVAVAFKNKFEVPRFNKNWAEWMAKYPHRIKTVPMHLPEDADANGVSLETETFCKSLPSRTQERFAVGRCAMKATGSQQVFAIGGPDILAKEAEASFCDGVCWSVCGFSPDEKKDISSASFYEFANRNREHPCIRFIDRGVVSEIA